MLYIIFMIGSFNRELCRLKHYVEFKIINAGLAIKNEADYGQKKGSIRMESSIFRVVLKRIPKHLIGNLDIIGKK